MLQSFTRVPGPKGPVPGSQIVAIPISNAGNGATPNTKAAAVQLPVVPVVLSAPQRLNQQQQNNKNFISPILDHSGSRKRQDHDHDFNSERYSMHLGLT